MRNSLGDEIMAVVFDEFVISTSKRHEVIDITTKVEDFIRNAQIENGVCIIHVPHATLAVITDEDEPGLNQDYIAQFLRIVPENNNYKHDKIDNNAHSHILSAILGANKMFPIRNGALVRGTWQNILLIELDGPRSQRKVVLEALGDA